MHLPPDAFKSDEGGGSIDGDQLPFLEVGHLLDERGLPVPKILIEDLPHRVVLLEDLGDETLESRLQRTPPERWAELYHFAIDLLVQLHDAFTEIPPSSVIGRRAFDRELLRWELDHFREWGAEALFGELPRRDRATLDTTFDELTEQIAALPTGFVHRDYQSRNLMWRAQDQLAIIDFQDAMIGPRVYDLVALLCDSYVDVSPTLQREMLQRYASRRKIDVDALASEFWLVTLHRKLKDAGRFVFIDRVRGNPAFLRWYPQSLVYVGRALGQLSEYSEIADVLARTIPGFPDEVARPTPVDR